MKSADKGAAAPQPGDLGALFGQPLGEFINARDALTRALRQAGRRDEAATVAALRKPGLHLWVVNQLARQRPVAVKRLLSTAADLADAQGEVLSGAAGAGDRLRRDSGEYQRALDQAVREAKSLLQEADRSSGEETLRRVREVLANAALGVDEQRRELGSGALASEPEAPGFGAFSLGPTGSPGAGVATAPTRRTEAKPAPAAEATARAAGRAEERAKREADDAAREEERRRRVEARRGLEAAEADLRRAEQAARRLRRRAEATAAEARAAAEQADSAEARRDEAREVVAEARDRLG